MEANKLKKAWDKNKLDNLFESLPKQTMSDPVKQRINNKIVNYHTNDRSPSSKIVWLTRGLLTAVTTMALLFFLFIPSGKQMTNDIFQQFIVSKEASDDKDGENDQIGSENDLVVITEEKEGISYEVTMPKRAYEEGEEIPISVTVTNISNADIHYVSGSSSCPTTGIITSIVYNNGEHLVKKPKQADDRACTDDINLSVLKQGESNKLEETFLMQYKAPHGSLIVPTGEYTVQVSFALVKDGNYIYSDENPALAIPITITTSNVGTVLNEMEVLEIAKDNVDLKEWVSNLDGNLLALLAGNGTQYYTFEENGEWLKVQGELKINKDYLIEAFPVFFDDGFWVVNFQGRKGYDNITFHVKIDAYTGDVMSAKSLPTTLTTVEDEKGHFTLEEIIASLEKYGIANLQFWESDVSVEDSVLQKKYSNTESVTLFDPNNITVYLYVCDSIEERKKVYQEFENEFKMKSFIYGTKIIDNVIVFYQGYQKRGLYNKEYNVRFAILDEELSSR
jgi:hypothetical protein